MEQIEEEIVAIISYNTNEEESHIFSKFIYIVYTPTYKKEQLTIMEMFFAEHEYYEEAQIALNLNKQLV